MAESGASVAMSVVLAGAFCGSMCAIFMIVLGMRLRSAIPLQQRVGILSGLIFAFISIVGFVVSGFYVFGGRPWDSISDSGIALFTAGVLTVAFTGFGPLFGGLTQRLSWMVLRDKADAEQSVVPNP